MDRPWGFQDVEVPTFQDDQHAKAVGLSALRTGRLYPQEVHLVLISVTDWVDNSVVARAKGTCQWKIPMTPSGFEPTSFRPVARCRNWLRYGVLHSTFKVPLYFKPAHCRYRTWIQFKSSVLPVFFQNSISSYFWYLTKDYTQWQ